MSKLATTLITNIWMRKPQSKMTFTISINACAALLLLQLLAFVFATVVTVVLNVSVVCTVALAVAVLATVMFLLWTHAMTVIIAIDHVDMIRRPILSFGHITDGL